MASTSSAAASSGARYGGVSRDYSNGRRVVTLLTAGKLIDQGEQQSGGRTVRRLVRDDGLRRLDDGAVHRVVRAVEDDQGVRAVALVGR